MTFGSLLLELITDGSILYYFCMAREMPSALLDLLFAQTLMPRARSNHYTMHFLNHKKVKVSVIARCEQGTGRERMRARAAMLRSTFDNIKVPTNSTPADANQYKMDWMREFFPAEAFRHREYHKKEMAEVILTPGTGSDYPLTTYEKSFNTYNVDLELLALNLDRGTVRDGINFGSILKQSNPDDYPKQRTQLALAIIRDIHCRSPSPSPNNPTYLERLKQVAEGTGTNKLAAIKHIVSEKQEAQEAAAKLREEKKEVSDIVGAGELTPEKPRHEVTEATTDRAASPEELNSSDDERLIIDETQGEEMTQLDPVQNEEVHQDVTAGSESPGQATEQDIPIGSARARPVGQDQGVVVNTDEPVWLQQVLAKISEEAKSVREHVDKRFNQMSAYQSRRFKEIDSSMHQVMTAVVMATAEMEQLSPDLLAVCKGAFIGLDGRVGETGHAEYGDTAPNFKIPCTSYFTVSWFFTRDDRLAWFEAFVMDSKLRLNMTGPQAMGTIMRAVFAPALLRCMNLGVEKGKKCYVIHIKHGFTNKYS